MRNLVMFMVLIAFMMSSGCATLDYFKDPTNQQVLLDAGVTCFESNNYTIGIEYGISRDGEVITNATQVGGIIGCDNKKFSVICDVTKGPDETPCTDLKSYTQDPPPNADAEVAPEVIPEVVPEPAVEPEVKVEGTPVALKCVNNDPEIVCEIKDPELAVICDMKNPLICEIKEALAISLGLKEINPADMICNNTKAEIFMGKLYFNEIGLKLFKIRA